MQIDSISSNMDTGIGAASREQELLLKNQSLSEKIRLLEQQLGDEKMVRKHTSNDLTQQRRNSKQAGRDFEEREAELQEREQEAIEKQRELNEKLAAADRKL